MRTEEAIMGYDVYITRAPHHLDGPQAPIRQEDWGAVIENDPELSTPNPAEPDRALWVGPRSRGEPWIRWANGNLFTSDPDHSVIRKLVELAGLLGGRVQGQGGERYVVEGGEVVLQDPELEALLGPRRDPARDPSPISERNASFSRPPGEALEVERSGRAAGVEFPFSVGQRVQTPWGRPATIISIDPHADSGIGNVELRYDDGRTATTNCLAHGLRPL